MVKKISNIRKTDPASTTTFNSTPAYMHHKYSRGLISASHKKAWVKLEMNLKTRFKSMQTVTVAHIAYAYARSHINKSSCSHGALSVYAATQDKSGVNI